MTEEDAGEVIEELINGNFRYSIKTEVENPYEDQKVLSVGIGPEAPMEGAVIHSPYTEYLGWAEEEGYPVFTAPFETQGQVPMYSFTYRGRRKGMG